MTLINEDQQPLATQGEGRDKQAGDLASPRQDHSRKESEPDEENPNHIDNLDDLHEIQVDDDLDEPDVEALQPGKKDDIDKNLPGELIEDTP